MLPDFQLLKTFENKGQYKNSRRQKNKDEKKDTNPDRDMKKEEWGISHLCQRPGQSVTSSESFEIPGWGEAFVSQEETHSRG